MKPKTVTIIGGGAAGFMAAITAAETFEGIRVILFEKSRTVLSKVRISGGGRCNVTHRPHPIKSFAKNYPRGEQYLRKWLVNFGPEDTIRWFTERGVPLVAEADGRMFPVTNTSETIIGCLVNEARRLGVEINTSTSVVDFEALQDEPGRFSLYLNDGRILNSDSLIITTGGHPSLSGFGWIAKHGIRIVAPVPSLFTFNSPQSPFLELAGVSLPEVSVTLPQTKHQASGPMLFTHWGVSGPAILRLSAFAARQLNELDYDFLCRINFAPHSKEPMLRSDLLQKKENSPKQKVVTHALWAIPARLWAKLWELAGAGPEQRWHEVSGKTMNRFIEVLTNYHLPIQGKTTFKEEFVTSGGVSLDEIHATTLESTKVKRLFFAGEVLDIDGVTGGFNFQNAWTTGYLVGKNCLAESY